MGRRRYKMIKTVVWIIAMLSIQLLLASSVAHSQKFSGGGVDAQSGETRPGVNVTVKGTNSGVATGGEGAYSLTVPSLEDTLVFSFVGYQEMQIPVDGRTTIDVGLSMEAIMGEDLIVVGYGTQEKATSTGSISTVGGAEMEETPTINTT